MIRKLFQDVRFALRSLRRTPGFTAAVVLTFALGTGGSTAIFSLVYGVLFRPLPFHEPERLVSAGPAMHGEYGVLREETRTLEALAMHGFAEGVNLFAEDRAERVSAVRVSPNLFRTLRVAPLHGRDFLEEDARPGADAAVIIGHDLWRDRFGADPGLPGRSILIDGEVRTVVGVMPAGFRFPDPDVRIWLPAWPIDATNPVTLWGSAGGRLVGRSALGVTVEEIRTELTALGARVREANTLWVMPDSWSSGSDVVGLRETLVGGARAPLVLLSAAVGFLLLIACANVANLFLVRSLARRRELAIRAALGAGRGQIVRQLLTESTVLAVLGGLAGLALAYWAMGALTLGLRIDTPRLSEVAMNAPVFLFAAGVTLLTGLAFGLFPALHASSPDVRAGMEIGRAGGGSTPGRRRVSNAFVVGEIACSVVLVTLAGLMGRSLGEMARIDPGFQPDRLVSARVTPEGSGYDEPAARQAFHRTLVERARALPGVTEAELVDRLPLVTDGFWGGVAFETEDAPYVPGAVAPTIPERWITTGYLRTMGIPLLAGRPLTDEDRLGVPQVALINEAMAREHWPGLDPVGKRFRPVWWQDDWITVVGVVGDVRQQALATEPEPEIYRPLDLAPAAGVTIVMRSAGGVGGIARPLRSLVAEIDPHVPVTEIRSLDEVRSEALGEPRALALLLGGFAFLALALGAIGIYGVISFSVARRLREFGVRVALGARESDVFGLVLGHGAALVAAGTLLGLAAALLLARMTEGLLFGVSARDPLTFALVPVVLAVTALVASWLPARRAVRVDPMIVLKEE